jgi:hypothetical protein
LIQPGSEFKLYRAVLVQSVFGVVLLQVSTRCLPFKVAAAVVLGFRIALRNGSQWSRPMRRRAAGGGDCRYA